MSKIVVPDENPGFEINTGWRKHNLAEGGVDMSFDALGVDRTLVVVALQALWRERVAARNAVTTVVQLSGVESPLTDAIFGIDEFSVALRRLGAAPIK